MSKYVKHFAARGARISLMSTNQGKRKGGTKEMIVLINHAENGRKYLYDILAVKKETSKP